MLLSDTNGCLCSAVRASAERNGNPMPADWVCIACAGRKKYTAEGHRCKKCGTGLMPERERDLKLCSNCQVDEGLL